MSPIPKNNHQEENDPDIQRIKILLKVLDIPWSKTKPSSTTYKRRCVVDTFGKCDFEVGFSENNKILFQINSRKSLTSNCLVGPYLVSKLKGSNWENEALDYYEGKNGNARGHKEGNGKQAKEGYIFVMEVGDPVDWNKMNEWKQRIKSGFKTFHDKLKEIDFSESKIKEFYDQNKNPDYDIDSYRDRITRRNASKVTSKEQEYTSRTGNKPMFTDIKALLESNLQVILTGAPGTGKTYTAKQVAAAFVDESLDEQLLRGDADLTYDDKENVLKRYFSNPEKYFPDSKELGSKPNEFKQAVFTDSVQFHPGYDYSDFVIGMKPVLLSKNGKELVMKEGRYIVADTGNEPDPEDLAETKVSFRWKDGIFKKFAKRAKDAYEKAEDKEKAPRFVFLIDEINRADLSRVFGELFSLLEEEYRYPNGKGTDSILLPNGERFSIPKNLFIIGTMNDIDRSVESMDFALRRRFAWKEVRATDTQKDILFAKNADSLPKIDPVSAEKLENAMNALNFEIAGEEVDGKKPKLDLRLGPEYELGGAIFAKFEKCNGDFNHLWKNHIQIILNEYLRGRSNRDPLLKEMEKTYDSALKKSKPINELSKEELQNLSEEELRRIAKQKGITVSHFDNPATGKRDSNYKPSEMLIQEILEDDKKSEGPV